MTLVDQDHIIVPALQKVVYMFGEFNLPTTIQYDNQSDIYKYIDAAGGLSSAAEKIIVVIDPDGVANTYKLGFAQKFMTNISIYPGSIVYAPRDIGQLDGIQYASTIAPVLSSLALTLASLNSIN